MSEIQFEVVENLGVLSAGSKGWQKELNMISWNGRKAKLDIRDWGPDHQRMGKGLTLNRDELVKLKELLNNLDLDSLDLD